MRLENGENDKITEEFGKRTEHMNDVKLVAALRQRQKYVLKVALKVWRQEKDEFKQTWSRIDSIFATRTIRHTF